MAAKKASKGNKGLPPIQFLNIPLNTLQKEEIKGSPYSAENLVSDLIRIVETGHKVSFTYIDGRGNVNCALTSPKRGDDDTRTVVSSYGPDVETAFQVAAYKFFVVTDGGKWDLDAVWENEDDIG